MARDEVGLLRQRVNKCMNKLSDRDTETMAANELSYLARSLSPDTIPPFISAISDTRPTDKTPLRRHSLRLLSLLSVSHPHQTLTPHLPRMLSSALKRIRDPDSSVRSACIHAVRSISDAVHSDSFSSTILGPLLDTLLHEQDQNAQITAALCLASAIEVKSGNCTELRVNLRKLVPKLVKLVKSNAFKAKASLISLMGSVVAARGADTSAIVKVLVPVLVEGISSEDWAARKASAEALGVLAVAERDLLVGFKSSCVGVFESRRFDKVKIVRDSMNRMLDLWKEIPDVIDDDSNANSESKSSVRESASDGRSSNSAKSNSPVVPRKIQFQSSRSPPPEASPVVRRNTPSIRKAKPSTPPSQTEHNVEISVPKTPLKVVNEEKTTNRLKSSARVVPYEEKGELEVESKEGNGEHKEGNDLSVIRMQLVQIENQQTSLLDLLQKFMGSSQNGIHSLETRVHGLEMALEVISRDISSGMASNPNPNESEAYTCCSFPGTEFLSPKYWRRNEGRFSSRFEGRRVSLSSASYKWSQTGFLVNPLAEINPQIMRESIRGEGTSNNAR